MSIHIIPCPHCGSNIPADSEVCMYCSKKVDVPVEETKVEPQKRKRPSGITGLSILNIFLGAASLYGLTQYAVLSGKLPVSGLNTAIIIAIGLLLIVSGVGLFLGKRWGWWIGAFYYFYRAVGSAMVFLLALFFVGIDDGANSEAGLDLARGFMRIIGPIVVIVFLYSKNVLQYFGIADHIKKRSTWVLIALALGISILNIVLRLTE